MLTRLKIEGFDDPDNQPSLGEMDRPIAIFMTQHCYFANSMNIRIAAFTHDATLLFCK
jgi:hypothetical protein